MSGTPSTKASKWNVIHNCPTYNLSDTKQFNKIVASVNMTHEQMPLWDVDLNPEKTTYQHVMAPIIRSIIMRHCSTKIGGSQPQNS